MNENTRKRLRILIPNFRSSPPKKTAEEKKMEKEKRKLPYCSVIPSMWKYHSIMFWMLHVLIMLFSSLEASEENSSRIEKMEAKISAAQRNVIYFLGNGNENVSQRTRYTFSFGLWFAFISFILLCFFYLRQQKEREGIKALSW